MGDKQEKTEFEKIVESVDLSKEQHTAISEYYANEIKKQREEILTELKEELDSEYEAKLQESLEIASKEMNESLTEKLTEQLTDQITDYVIAELETAYGQKFEEIASSMNRVYENKLLGIINNVKKELREQVETEFHQSGEYQAFNLIKEAVEPFVVKDDEHFELKSKVTKLEEENSTLKDDVAEAKVSETITKFTSKVEDEKVRAYIKEALKDCKTEEEVITGFEKQLALARGLKEATEEQISSSLDEEIKQEKLQELSEEEYKFLKEGKNQKGKVTEQEQEQEQEVLLEAQEAETEITPVVEKLEESSADSNVIDFRNRLKRLADVG